MSAGDIFLVLAALSALICLAAAAANVRRDSASIERISRFSAYASFLFLTLVFLLLSILFLTSDLRYDYVWSHSSTTLDPFYKLVGVWAGGEGGLVLWAWFMGLAVILEIFFQRKREFSDRFQMLFRIGGISMVLLFCLILMAGGLFSPTTASDLASNPNGLGMNLSLQTVEMAVHPPVLFAGFAFCLIPFSAALAYLITRDERWRSVAVPWSRVSLFILSVGILVGGIWAYYELGWGGFWVWDPVETASLFPWLILVAFLHLKNSERSGALLPFLGMLGFTSALFSAFITRTGGLWGSSVHSYGSTVQGDIESRFLTVLMADKSIMGLFAVVVILLAIGAILAYRGRKWSIKKDEGWDLATVVLLLLSVALMIALLVKNTDLSQGQNFVELTERMSFLAVAILIALSARIIWTRLGELSALLTIAAIIGISILLAIAAQVTAAFPWLVGFVLPSSIAAIAVSLQNIARFGLPQGRKWLRKVGPQLVHIGIAIVLVGFVVSSTMQAALPQGKEIMTVGDSASVGDHSIELIGISESVSTDHAGNQTVSRMATFNLDEKGGKQRTITITNLYSNASMGTRLEHGGTYIQNGLTEDLYINFDWMGNTTALVQARVVPMVTEVWFGAVLVILGTLATTLSGKLDDDAKRTYGPSS